MADITMCSNMKCPLRHECYRYMAKENPYRQGYYLNNPNPKNLAQCPEHWAIVDGKINGYDATRSLDQTKYHV